jgi:hypothetical protein
LTDAAPSGPVSSTEAAPGALATRPARPRRRRALVVAASVVIAAAVVAAAVWTFAVYLRPHAGPIRNVAAGFASGRVLTLHYSGNYSCAPTLLTLYPAALEAAGHTSCEIGRAEPGVVPPAAPVWMLVPAFAGLSVFGLQALGASPRGMPMFGGLPWLADCGGGGAPSACANHPTAMYAPAYLAVERALGFVAGPEGLPLGVLPTPAFDALVNASAAHPAVSWSTVVVWVFDPNIFPNRTDGSCRVVVPSSLPSPTAHCLTSVASVVGALGTMDTAVAAANSANALWRAWGAPPFEAVLLSGSLYTPNSNLYVSFSTSTGAPAHQPT